MTARHFSGNGLTDDDDDDDRLVVVMSSGFNSAHGSVLYMWSLHVLHVLQRFLSCAPVSSSTLQANCLLYIV